MATKDVLLGFQVERPKYTKDANTGLYVRDGGYQTIPGNAIIKLNSNVVTYFDIPVFTGVVDEAASFDIADIKDFSTTKYGDIDDTAGRQVNVRGGQRLAGGSRSKVFSNSVRVPTGRVTDKGNLRTVSIAFPSFFNLIMIAQALGTMIKTTNTSRKPSIFISKGGRSYPIPYGTSTSPLTDANGTVAKSGAWLLSAPLTPRGTADGGDDIPTTTTKGTSKGGGKASAT